MAKQIPLTRGLQALVDDDDYEDLAEHKWCAAKSGKAHYACRRVVRDGRSMLLYMHRQITGYRETDHIDGDGLNNRRANLREVTGSQNKANRTKWAGGSSRFLGVCWHSRGRRWQASLEVKVGAERLRWSRTFRDEIEAARARDEKAREVFGEFGVYNFPRPGERSALTGEVLPG